MSPTQPGLGSSPDAYLIASHNPSKPITSPVAEALVGVSLGPKHLAITKVISGAVPMNIATWPAVSRDVAHDRVMNGSTCPITDKVTACRQTRSESGQRDFERKHHNTMELVATKALTMATVSGAK